MLFILNKNHSGMAASLDGGRGEEQIPPPPLTTRLSQPGDPDGNGTEWSVDAKNKKDREFGSPEHGQGYGIMKC